MILGRFKVPSTELSARAWLLLVLGVAHPRAGDGEVGRDGGGSVARRAQRTCAGLCVSAAGGAVGSAGRERGRDMFKGAQRAATERG
jgi:hypothetical protein